jgi:hypothetical protein
MEDGTTIGVWIAYAAIVAFLVLLVLVITRTIVMYTLLTIMPISRILRRVPGMAGWLDHIETRAAEKGLGRR